MLGWASRLYDLSAPMRTTPAAKNDPKKCFLKTAPADLGSPPHFYQRKGAANTETFTVRKMASGIGVERVFPIASPLIENIEVNKRGKVRRARIYYLRELTGKAARIKERRVIAKK